VLPAKRLVDPNEPGRLRTVILDVALAAGGRECGATGPSAVAADAWTFINDRAARLAIRLVAVTGKAPAPVHPHHLVDLPGHFWYRQLLRSDDRLIDVGCADGSHTVPASRHVREAVGVDIDSAYLARAETRARGDGRDNVRFVRGDLTDPRTLAELGAEPFDVVLLLDVLEHLVERERLLRAIRSLLRPNGRLVVAVPNRDTPYRRWLRRMGGFTYSDPDHKLEYTAELLTQELSAAGFRVASIEPGGYDTPFGGLSTLVAPVSLRAYARLARRRHRRAVARPGSATALRAVAVPDEPATASS
jgi:SAM-dependent methyltransferase